MRKVSSEKAQHGFPGSTLRVAWLALAILLALVLSIPARAQKPAPQAKPGDFGLTISAEGPVRAGEGRHVLVKQAEGGEKVAKVHVDVGDRRLVILPNGRLDSFPISETKATDQSFVPATKDQMIAELNQ